MGQLSFYCPEKTVRHTETNADDEQPNTEKIQTEPAEEQATSPTMEQDTMAEPPQDTEQETTLADYNKNNVMDTSLSAR